MSSKIIEAVEDGKNIDEVLELAAGLTPEKIKESKRSINSSRHSFDAIAKYKATTDKLDKFLIYKACCN